MGSEADQDAQWIEGIRQGDEAAFAALVRAYYTGLFDFACALTRSPEAAEDVVQDVLLGLWVHRAGWQPHGSARAYLFGAVRNRALNARRDRRRTAPLDEPDRLDPSAPAADADLAYHDLLAAYQSAVDELPERRREVFRLNRLYGLSYEEVGAALGISLNTVRTQMTAALRHLRERLLR